MEINVCIPTLNSYNELKRCIESINNSSVKVDHIYVIDNGGWLKLEQQENIIIKYPTSNLGVAASWNWFIDNVKEYRIICNDDVEFESDTIRQMIDCYDENSIVCPNRFKNENTYSCFLLPQNIINIVGKFDESLSPQYAYFEDNDYDYRAKLAGFEVKECEASISHKGSSTLKNYNSLEERIHHDKFRLARKNYVAKWGSTPGTEIYKTPFNR